jgi:SAM-dependent methyltransferase
MTMHVHSAFSTPKTFLIPSLNVADARQLLHSKDSISLTPPSEGTKKTKSDPSGNVKQDDVLSNKLDSTIKAPTSPISFNALFQKYPYEDLVEHGGNWSHGSFQNFTAARKFIADTIPKSGTILDIGCANGFMLRCFQEWVPPQCKLVPYGVDINPNCISESRKIYPDLPHNFVVQNVRDYFRKGPPKGFPQTYDYIYFSLLGLNDKPEFINQLLMRVKPGGRLILGFYGSIQKEKMEEFRKVLTEAKKGGIQFTKIIENKNGYANIVAYIQKEMPLT